MTSITIPDSVTSIGVVAFAYCSSLTKVYFEGDQPTTGAPIFESISSPSVIFYYHYNANGWSTNFADRPTVACAFLEVVSSGGGSADLSPTPLTDSPSTSSNLWYTLGTSVVFTASSASNSFQGWSGDLSGTSTNESLVMDSDKIVLASFGNSDLDGDGILDYDENSIYGTSPFLSDSDGDGSEDNDELTAGTSPTNRTDVFQIKDMTTASNQTDSVFSWSTVSNRTYSVYSNANLNTDWSTNPAYQVEGDGTQKSFTNTHSENSMFYRVDVELGP